MLKPKPTLQHHAVLWAWQGTPRAFADAIAAVRDRALPDAWFQAEVESRGRPARTADDPSGLAMLEPGEKVRDVRVHMSMRPRQLTDDRTIVLMFRHRKGHYAFCEGRNEIEARQMRAVAEEALKPGVPWWGRGLLLLALVRFGPPYLALFAVNRWATYLDVEQRFGEVRGIALYLGGVVVLVGAVFAAMRALTPRLELHAGRMRMRRFAWSLVTLVVLPLAFLGLRLLLDS